MITRATMAFVALAAGIAGCGGGSERSRYLNTWVRWTKAPGAPAEIGYEVHAEIVWPGLGACEGPFSNLRVTANERAAPMSGPVVDCDMTARFRATGFADGGPTTIRLFDSDQLIGEATFDGLFPGLHPRLVTPLDGQLAAGEDLIVTLPSDYPGDLLGFLTAEFYWLDTPTGVPPFHTSSEVVVMPDGRSMKTKPPDQPGLAGRAALVFLLSPPIGPPASSCHGFTSCQAILDGVAGPIDVTVLGR